MIVWKVNKKYGHASFREYLLEVAFDVMKRIDYLKKEAVYYSCEVNPYVEKRIIEFEEGE